MINHYLQLKDLHIRAPWKTTYIPVIGPPWIDIRNKTSAILQFIQIHNSWIYLVWAVDFMCIRISTFSINFEIMLTCKNQIIIFLSKNMHHCNTNYTRMRKNHVHILLMYLISLFKLTHMYWKGERKGYCYLTVARWGN